MVNSNQAPGLWHDGIAIVRIVVGVMLIFHGWQIFEEQDMQGFADLFVGMSMPYPDAIPYVGKVIEILGGLLLLLGLFTRLATALSVRNSRRLGMLFLRSLSKHASTAHALLFR